MSHRRADSVKKLGAKKRNLRWRQKHRDRINAKYRSWYASGGKVQESARHFFRKYGITLEDRARMWSAQNGKCLGCGCEIRLEANRRGDPDVAVVDHNHGTGKVRGMLCSRCNSSIGYSLDSPVVLRRLADYLESTAHEGNKE